MITYEISENWHSRTQIGHCQVAFTTKDAYETGCLAPFRTQYRPLMGGLGDKRCVRNRLSGSISYAYQPSVCHFFL